MKDLKSNRWRILLTILILLLSSRIVLYFTLYLGHNLFSQYTVIPQYQKFESNTGLETYKLDLPGSLFSARAITPEVLTRFDAKWYIDIAQKGYEVKRIDEPHPAANWVFFPLYPLLLKVVQSVSLGLSYPSVGIILSNFFLLIALLYLYYFSLQRGLSPSQGRAILFFILIYPASIYFSLPYTESLFLLLSAATLYYSFQEKYSFALISAGLSAVTRVPGFINLLLVVALYLFTQREWKKKAPRFLLWFSLSLIPFFLFLLHMRSITGDFLAPLHEQSLSWARETTIPFINLLKYILHPYFIASGGWDNGILSFIVTLSVLFIYLLYLIKNRERLGQERKELIFLLYGFLLIVVPFSSSLDHLTSVIRYMMVSLPFYYFLVDLSSDHPILKDFYTLLYLSLNIIISIAYVNDYYFVV